MRRSSFRRSPREEAPAKTLSRPSPRSHAHHLLLKLRDLYPRSEWSLVTEVRNTTGPTDYCAAWWLVVPAPWKNILLSLSELPNRWGLIEIGTGGPSIVQYADERDAEHPLPGFMKSLLRTAVDGGDQDRGEGSGVVAPLSPITRPTLSRSHVGLACGHTAQRPLLKIMPRALPCFDCVDGKPSDPLLIRTAIEEATPEQRAEYLALLLELDP